MTTFDDKDRERLRVIAKQRAEYVASTGDTGGEAGAAIDALVAKHLPTRLEPTEEAIAKYAEAWHPVYVSRQGAVDRLKRFHAAGLLKDEYMREVTE